MSTSSLRSLKLKLLTGYLLLVMLFGVVLTLLVYERRKVEQTTRRTEELVEQRAETERILLDLLDLAFQGEQSVGWETSDMEAYRSKSDSVGIALDNLRLHLGDSVQSGRVERISCLLDQKEEHLFAVMKDIRALREHNRLVQERIPSVIRQTARQSAFFQHNYKKISRRNAVKRAVSKECSVTKNGQGRRPTEKTTRFFGTFKTARPDRSVRWLMKLPATTKRIRHVLSPTSIA